MPTKRAFTYLSVAEEWPTLSSAERARRFLRLPHEAGHEFFFDLGATDQADVLLALPPGERRHWIRLLAPDDVADVIQAAPEDQRGGLLSLLDEPTRAEVAALLAYAEDEAGGLMNPRYMRVRPDMTVAEALGYFRRQARALSRATWAGSSIILARFRLCFAFAFTRMTTPQLSITIPAIMVCRFYSTRFSTVGNW